MKFLRFGLYRLLFLASWLVPRDKNLWVFIGWHGREGKETFADNTKYLFLHASNNCRPGIEAVWLSKDRALTARLRAAGFVSHHHRSIAGIWCALRAGTTFIDAYLQPENFRWSGGTKLVQLLHGKGMKKKGYSKPQLRAHHYIFGPSKYVLELLPESFTRKSEMHVMGYPRNDVFYQPIEGADISIDSPTRSRLKAAEENGLRTVLYAPTFRRGHKTFDISDILDLPNLEPWMREQGIFLFINLHPKYRDQARTVQSTHIHFIDESDLHPLFSHFDLLISDYSSIFTDFLLLDKPLVFYPYDLEEYSRNEGVGVDYDSHTPGEKAYNAADLRNAIVQAFESGAWQKERARVRALYHAFTDGKASERIVSFLREKENL